VRDHHGRQKTRGNRPHLTFFTESSPSQKIVIYMASQLQGDEGPAHELSDIKDDFVQEMMLNLLERLVSEVDRS